MEVGVGAVGHVVVDDDVDALDVDAACDEVGRDEDALVTLLERFVPRQALLLRHAAVDGDGRKVALGEELVEVRAALHGLDEDDHLVEHERVEEIVELAVLLRLGQLDVVLDEAVEGELGLVVDVNLHRVVHELFAHGANLLGQRRGKHHDLLVVRGHLEDLLDVRAHVELLEHLIALVEDEVAALLERDVAVLGQRLAAAGGGDDDARGLLLELRLLLLDVDAAEDDGDVHRGEVRAEALELVLDLVRQLARVAEDQRANLARDGLELLEDREHEHRGLAHAGLGLADDIHAQDRLGDALVLNCWSRDGWDGERSGRGSDRGAAAARRGEILAPKKRQAQLSQ
mmetsp:Transcript_9342/g.40993  ORF Transcript_9342/g.40993 Transcript_9342/m.40993 type:complete len:344 (+) Transcript_9342:410-1441(+)